MLPADIDLFDKSFNDITLRDRQGREFHLIMLHTVPAYHFGNKQTPNYIRNADQLNFLLWYVSGETFSDMRPPKQIRPLVPGTPFIIVGDLNVDIKSQHPGAIVLKEMLKHGIQSVLPDFPGTYLGDDISTMPENRTLLNLDYILYSSHFSINSAGVYLPPSQKEDLDCLEEKLDQDQELELKQKVARSGKVLVEYLKENKLCRILLAKDFYELAKSSDHLPVWASFEWK
jgi:endonuclease/exonuclease/phosphatase family metal-dependent hydrolase